MNFLVITLLLGTYNNAPLVATKVRFYFYITQLNSLQYYNIL